MLKNFKDQMWCWIIKDERLIYEFIFCNHSHWQKLCQTLLWHKFDKMCLDWTSYANMRVTSLPLMPITTINILLGVTITICQTHLFSITMIATPKFGPILLFKLIITLCVCRKMSTSFTRLVDVVFQMNLWTQELWK
jgi:hypothetical protein